MKFAPYTSGRLKELNIGITSYSEDKTPLDVVGNVSIGGSLTVNNNLTVKLNKSTRGAGPDALPPNTLSLEPAGLIFDTSQVGTSPR